MSSSTSRSLVVLSQVFVPDPAAVGQYMSDAAEALAADGWRVRVYAADRGYDDPRQRFPRREIRNGVEIHRLPFSSFGKRSIPLRLLGQLSFVVQSFLRLLFARRLDAILVSTSPPMGGVVAWAASLFRRAPIHFWVMDINPDQSVKLGAFRPGHPFVRIFDRYMRAILKKATSIIALDRYMATSLREKMGGVEKADGARKRGDGAPQVCPERSGGRLKRVPPGRLREQKLKTEKLKGRQKTENQKPSYALPPSPRLWRTSRATQGKPDNREPTNREPDNREPETENPSTVSSLFVLPPWPMDDYLAPVERSVNPFVAENNLLHQRVFLYSGNHSLAHPIATFLEAAVRLKEDPRAAFLFVGGGKRKGEVDEAARSHAAQNLHSLPYQPLEKIRYSLSAGDIHLVSMGEEMVGCVHPCKFYSALALGKPILYLGPRDSHIGDLLAEHDIGWRIDHGDTDGMESLYREILATPPEELQKKGTRARCLVENGPFQRKKMVREFVEIINRVPKAQ